MAVAVVCAAEVVDLEVEAEFGVAAFAEEAACEAHQA